MMAQLDQLGIADNTLVVFTSDNGGGGKQNGPLRGGKSSLWEGGYRVPMIARLPGQIPAGQVSNRFMASLDFLPTMAGIAGAKLPEGVRLDGINAASGARREAMFWQRRGDKAARVGEWKWIESEQGSGLFHLPSDPGEQRDLSASKPAELAMMKERWKAWRKEMDESEPRGPFRDY
jgi:arylsulfatase A-like enzyme